MNHDSLRNLVESIREVSPNLGARAEAELLKEVRVSPTLVKYADPNTYEIETRRELRQIASELDARCGGRSGSVGGFARRRAARRGARVHDFALRALPVSLPPDSPKRRGNLRLSP